MLYFDDLPVGYRSTVGTWLLERDEIVEFAKRWDPQPFHIDEERAADSVFGGLVASSLHLFAICTRLFFDHADRIQIMAMLGQGRDPDPEPGARRRHAHLRDRVRGERSLEFPFRSRCHHAR